MVETLYRDNECNFGPVDDVPELDPGFLMTSWIRDSDRRGIIRHIWRESTRTYEVLLDNYATDYEVNHLMAEISRPIGHWTLLAMRKEDYAKYYLYDYPIYGTRLTLGYVCLNCELDDATVKSHLRPFVDIKAMTRNIFYRRDYGFEPLRRKGVIEIVGTRTHKPLPPWVLIEGRVVGIREPGNFGDTLSMECSNNCRRGLTKNEQEEIKDARNQREERKEVRIKMEDRDGSDGDDSAIGEDVGSSRHSSVCEEGANSVTCEEEIVLSSIQPEEHNTVEVQREQQNHVEVKDQPENTAEPRGGEHSRDDIFESLKQDFAEVKRMIQEMIEAKEKQQNSALVRGKEFPHQIEDQDESEWVTTDEDEDSRNSDSDTEVCEDSEGCFVERAKSADTSCIVRRKEFLHQIEDQDENEWVTTDEDEDSRNSDFGEGCEDSEGFVESAKSSNSSCIVLGKEFPHQIEDQDESEWVTTDETEDEDSGNSNIDEGCEDSEGFVESAKSADSSYIVQGKEFMHQIKDQDESEWVTTDETEDEDSRKSDSDEGCEDIEGFVESASSANSSYIVDIVCSEESAKSADSSHDAEHLETETGKREESQGSRLGAFVNYFRMVLLALNPFAWLRWLRSGDN